MEQQEAIHTPLFPDWKEVSPKEAVLNDALLRRATGKAHALLAQMLADPEIHLYHSYANAVSVRRLGYNDHGPVHARITTYNALKLLRLLHESGIQTSLEEEEVGSYEDSQVAVALGTFLHDVGMGVTREDHERHSITLADAIINRYLADLYAEGDPRRVVLRALAHEVIVGHMANVRVHSVEAGVTMVADGTDMARGRSRIPQLLSRDPVVGDMHRFSASAIVRVDLTTGDAKPVRIAVTMENVTGLFQIEEVLMTKVKASPILPYVELCALVGEDPPRFYLR
jgi:metal-dependent HD superfamily phosphatase/phosphodiesterase